MSLEFAKVITQVERMGRYLSHRATSMTDRLALAVERLTAADDLEAIHARIKLVRDSVSGYRGAAPAPLPFDEPINMAGTPADVPQPSVLIAADGSQIYPDPHGAALYYLLNIGLFTTFVGQERLPLQATQPTLEYVQESLVDKDGRTITNPTVNTRRTIAEVATLAAQAWHYRTMMNTLHEVPAPIFALHDGALLKFFSPTEVADALQLEAEYYAALRKLHDAGAVAAGYIDRPRSSSVISLLHLLSLRDDEVNDAAVRTNGEIEGVSDADLFARYLAPGQRSAIFTQNSPQNRDNVIKHGADYEIAFFYVNVGAFDAQIARVEIPMWVGKDRRAVASLHSLLLAQCAIQGRRRYPYALTRADELAFVNPAEKHQLDELVRVEMMRQNMQPERSNKLESKGLARADKRSHQLGV